MIKLEDITSKSGLSGLLNYRIAIDDLNNDDMPDLLSVYATETSTKLRVFYNTTNQTGKNLFTENAEIGELTEFLSTDIVSVFDINQDGQEDIITIGHYLEKSISGDSCLENTGRNESYLPNIFLGNGGEKFIDMPFQDVLLQPINSTSATCVNVADFNKDGKPDIYVGSWYDSRCMNKPMHKFLFVSFSDALYIERKETAEKSGLMKNNKGLFGSTTTDWNNDGWMDIITCPYDTTGFGNLFKNNGDGTFTDVAEDMNYSPCTMKGDNKQPMVPWEAMPCDFDNDGDMDFALALVHGGSDIGEGRTCILENLGIKQKYKLKVRNDIIVRVNPQDSHHGDHKVVWCDLNNDGWQDLIISDAGYEKGPGKGRVHFCLQNPTTHKLIDVTVKTGLVDTITGLPAACINQPHAVEPIDFDMDGDEDVVIGKMGLSDFGVLENKDGNNNNWIKIKLIAPEGVNADCIGARVKITAGGITQTKEVSGPQGHYGGQQWYVLHVGVGKSKKIDKIEITWPDKKGSKTMLKKVKVNQFIKVSNSGIIKP
ncbi:MAG: CRTAC1 family protein [Flavobacteriales bacterium]